MRWLLRDLRDSPVTCTLAYWHAPRFSSSPHGDNFNMRDVWRVLYEAGTDIVINGHDHRYERFRPQDFQGRFDPKRGVRQFIVGTGGAGLYKVRRVRRNSEIYNDNTYGVLKLTLVPGSYQWEFVPVAGGSFRDAGTGSCNRP